MARYPRMRMGTIVLSQSYRPPALMAKAAAVLQWLSGGRLIFGIGAGPKVTLRIVAKYADWCNLNGFDLEMCRSRLTTLRQHCLAVGRDHHAIGITYSNDCVAVAPSHAQAEHMTNASFFRHSHTQIMGTPDEVAAQIQPLVDLGVTHFIFRFVDFPRTEGVQLFMDEVMPRFKQS
jgi:alkanesulfonate monooxygenase SsuD/methylene tetrahydromethanopterin reductase-like flavin-dependent oxidoreductase (luciferase family)